MSDQLPLLEDDRHEPGVFEARHLHEQLDLPRVAVLCFFNELLGRLAQAGELTEVYELRSEIGRNPVYRYDVAGTPVIVVHPGLGAPMAAGVTEELCAIGVTTFAACGGAGALRPELDLGHVMVVADAVRDEGTSLHYAAPGRYIEADPRGIAAFEGALAEDGWQYVTGRSWTTDAIFRETRSRIDRRVAEGCRMVEMEAAAFMAVARYRGVAFGQALYAGDTLVGEWDSRGWERAHDLRERLFRTTAKAAVRLAQGAH